jgi:hypothetical protein
MWCLARANEPPCALSSRELLILAKLGQLRADDLVWRSGTNAKQTIRALLGAGKPSPARPMLNGMRLPPANFAPIVPAPAPAREDAGDIDASLIAAASGAEQHGRGRNWALAGALAGVAIVAVSFAAVGAVVFLQPADPPKPIATRLMPQDAEPEAAGDAAQPQPPVTTDEVAVRKVKVLEIPPPPVE